MEKRKASLDRLKELTRGIRFAMLTTVGDDGSLHSRPMFTQEIDADGDLWFFTHADSHKVEEIEHERHVNVSYADPDKNRWVSVAGRARLVTDKQKMAELWSPTLKAWFPRGIDDPNILLLKVHVESAQFWDHPQGRMVQLLGLARAIVTGKAATDLYKVEQLDLSDRQPSQ